MLSTASVHEALAETRAATLDLIAPFSDAQLESQFTPLMSPLVWDLAHIAAYEDLWLGHRHGGRPLLRPELAAMYDAFETPRPVRGALPLLDTAGAHAYLDAVRERSCDVLERHGPGDGTLVELVLRHELQHTETMRQALELGGMDGYEPVELAPLPGDPLEMLAIPAGPWRIGAGPAGFAYDNERPRHIADVAAFRIGKRPVTAASWLSFAEGGGYERREWWSDEGWAWKEEYDITHHAARAGGDPSAPVCHVSWFEADAFARSLGARLPTEVEWEKAATWDQRTRQVLEGLTGSVWQWTASEFTGYPGFVAHPYREYSEVFFDRGYRVLRGGSWATATRVATPTFRNWDLPERRQIFAGLRLAMDG